jgi:Insertion element 4 transposase N-terminal/Transposase DDE domain
LRPQSVTTTTLTRTVTVAAGVFAPGHLGELTRFLPFELVDDVLVQTRTVQQRLRELPSRTGVYFVLALGLFPRIGYARVWGKLVAGLAGAGLAVPAVSEKALRELRRRIGPAPLKALFEVVAGPLAQPRTPGTCFAGLRTVAFDGLNSLKVPDTDRNRGWMGRIRYRMGFAGYPTLRLMCLAETGTRALLGATIGAAGDRDEATLARRLLPLLRPGMLVLLDRGFDAATFLAAVHDTGAMLLARARSQRVPPVLQHLPDGSYLSELDGLAVRIIEADLRMRGADGTAVGDLYRLITTLLDHQRYPADALIRLYHERWEIESAYLALRTHDARRARPAVRGPGRTGARSVGAADALPAAAAWPWSTRWRPAPAPTPTGPASPPPCRPPATSSSLPPESAPIFSPASTTSPSTGSGSSARPC